MRGADRTIVLGSVPERKPAVSGIQSEAGHDESKKGWKAQSRLRRSMWVMWSERSFEKGGCYTNLSFISRIAQYI